MVGRDSSDYKIEVYVTDEMKAELDRLKSKSGLSYQDLISRGFTLLRIYVDCLNAEKKIGICSKEGRLEREITVPGFEED